MNYIVYKVTNKQNGRFYIGVHRTKDIQDEYMGSGKRITNAIRKHGASAFTKEILFVFDNEQAMLDKERELVTPELLESNETYNLKLGGVGGFDHINKQPIEERVNIKTQKRLRANGVYQGGGTKGWTEDSRAKVLAVARQNISKGNGTKAAALIPWTQERRQQASHRGKTNNAMSGKVWCVEDTATDLSNRKPFENIPIGWISTAEWKKKSLTVT